MNLKTLTMRAELMTRTDRARGTCRIPRMQEIGTDWGEGVLALAWRVAGFEGEPPLSVQSSCGTAGCVIHLSIKDVDERHEQIVLQSWKPTRSLAQMFRAGRARGLFQALHSYAD